MKKREYYLSVLWKNRTLIIAAAIAVIIALAAVLFNVYGNSKSITIEEAEASTKERGSSEQTHRTESTVFIDIGGCVKEPGVYEVPAESRVFEVIEKAGGLSKDADVSSVNQAETVSDGQKIVIPDKSEVKEQEQAGSSSAFQTDPQGRININNADKTALEEIPGVGPVTAEKIIAYREQNGRFGKSEDIKNVSGIGDKTYEKMKEHITC